MGPRAQIFWFCVGAGALSLSAAICHAARVVNRE
jgi:hypothetical protein